MSNQPSLTATFLSHAQPLSELQPDQLESLLTTIIDSARATWTEVSLDISLFVRHLSEHGLQGAPTADPLRLLREVNAADLYLACACMHGIPSALSIFDNRILSQVAVFVSKIDASPAFADEVKQSLRTKLLVASPGARPKIAEYAGRGTLLGWVRIAATRVAINLRRGRQLEADSNIDQETLRTVASAPEHEFLRRRYQREFVSVLQEAFRLLPQEQRNVLRMHYAGGLSGDQIGALLHISRATVVRWLANARSMMFQQSRRLLQERLRLTQGEFDSLVGLLLSQLDVNLSSILTASAD